MLETQNYLQNRIKNAEANFFYSQPSTLPKEALRKFYLSTTFGLSFMINSVAPTRSSTSYRSLKIFAITFLFFDVFLSNWFSYLPTNESTDIKSVYHPSNSKATWLRMIVNLITKMSYIISMVMEAIRSVKA